MPEYLAPGVYVEETSFRAKSIEGVGTSTTAFVGPTRKGPLAVAEGAPKPELLTSFGDFTRIYGGLEPLGFASTKPNYLANAVLNFFNEGGARLYVARVATGAQAAVLRLVGADGDAGRIHLRARFVGASGNGNITVQETLAPATKKAMAAAPNGTLVRAGGTTAPTPAKITGAAPTFNLPNGSKLKLLVNGTPKNYTFTGASAEVTGGSALADPVVIPGGGQAFTVEIDGVSRTTHFAAGNIDLAQFVSQLNAALPGAYVGLTDDDKLVIGSDTKGSVSKVKVVTAAFGFAANTTSAATASNVSDITAATLADIAAVIAADATADFAATVAGGQLTLTTTATGATATLTLAAAAAGETLAHSALGLGAPIPGTAGAPKKVYAKVTGTWTAADASTLTAALALVGDGEQPTDGGADFIRLTVAADDADGERTVFDELEFDSASPRSVAKVLPLAPSLRAEQLLNAFWFDIGGTVSALLLHGTLFSAGATGGNVEEGLVSTHTLVGGDDGAEPVLADPGTDGSYAAAFAQLLGLEDISIVAAPGHSDYACYQEVQGALISHAEKPRAYRVAVLDTPPDLLPGGAREERARIDSKYAALYYPWITVGNPLARPGRSDIPKEINLPPSGFLTGIYARNDVEKGVAKAPANEVVRGALRFALDVNFGQNQLLNPLGVNCLRFFPGRGYRVWGARTVSSDPEWKYINVRRYFVFLEASIDRGTQWAVFENNGERLWSNIRETIEAFLYNEWVSGNLLGSSPKEAYFVRCDRSTMTQNDLDNGRLICLIGVAALKPAEFVIFRIGQKTADART